MKEYQLVVSESVGKQTNGTQKLIILKGDNLDMLYKKLGIHIEEKFTQRRPASKNFT